MNLRFLPACVLLSASMLLGADAPRAARSVHLGYTAPAATAFYIEMKVEKSVPGSYFMAAGFNHGYFGIQELSNGKKVVLFSVWDPTKGDDAKAVKPEERVEVLFKADDVDVKRFGGEGTGGQSFFKHEWKLEQTCRFLIKATPEESKTAYAAWFFLPDQNEWKHLVTFRTRTGGDKLKGLYSFVEDFRRDTKSAGEARRAVFTNGWVKGDRDEWKSLTQARFTASGATWEAKETIDAGLAGDGFYLQTGGDTKTTTPLNSKMERKSAATVPADLPRE